MATRAELYAARDRSGLAPAEYYQRFLVPASAGHLDIDLAGLTVPTDGKG